MTSGSNGWDEYRLLVLRHVDRAESFQKHMLEEIAGLRNDISQMRTEIAVSKTQIGVGRWTVVTLISFIMSLIVVGAKAWILG